MIPLNRPPRSKDRLTAECRDETQLLQQLRENHHLSYTFSAREGLQAAYADLYLKRGKMRVGVSPLTCFEALYPIVQNGHEIVFIDIDRNTFNLDESKLFGAELDAVQLIHLGGNPQRLDKVKKWSAETNGIIIEDCAQALGATYNNRLAGTVGNYAVFSMVKNVFSPSGGLLLSENQITISGQKAGRKVADYKSIKQRLESRCTSKRLSVSNGLYWLLMKLRDTDSTQKKSSAYQLDSGQKQSIEKSLRCISELNEKRQSSYVYITSLLNREQVLLQKVPSGGVSCYNRLMLLSNERNAVQIIEELRKRGIAANNLTQSYMKPHQPTVYNSADFSGFAAGANLEVYQEIHERLFAVPFSPYLKKAELKYIAESVNEIAAAR